MAELPAKAQDDQGNPEDQAVDNDKSKQGVFSMQLTGIFEYKKQEFKGVAGVYKVGGQKGFYVLLKPGKGDWGLPELIALFADQEKGSGPETPPVLGKLPKIKSFYLKYDSGANSKNFVIAVDISVKINDTALDLTLSYRYNAAKGYKGSEFGGVLKVGNHRFTVQFSSKTITPEGSTDQQGAGGASKANSYLLARYDYEEALNLKTLFDPLFKGDHNFIPDITIKDFKAFLLFSKKGDQSRFLLGIGAGLGNTLSLENLPLAGKILKEDKSFSIDEILVLVSWGSFEKAEFKALNGGKAERFKLPEPDSDIGKTSGFAFHLSIKLTIGKERKAYFFSPGQTRLEEDAEARKRAEQIAEDPKTEDSSQPTLQTKANDVTSIPGTVSSSAKWINIKKKLGPVDLKRIGFGYYHGNIIILLDSSITIAALGVQLKGFGLGFQPKWPPKVREFYLDGLGISFKKDPIEVSGAFLRGTEKVNGKDVNVYTGAAILKLSKFTISGIGSYATVEETDGQGGSSDKYASLFIYAAYNGPLGGPAFFFINGIAAGFGINRKVNAPPIEEVKDFPLVSLVLNPQQKDLMDILADLQTPSKKTKKLAIQISRGDYWLAVGIKFTSFKIIDSFLLLIVSFGNRLRFDILGLSVLAIPPKIGKAIKSLVYIEMALKISFGTDSDVISVEAVITPNSYIISKDGKLRGGFALYIWVSGPHEGEFVVTLGGYHPRFNKPAHYPNVDRLSLNWKFPIYPLTIKGEMYFALTPIAIMAGGRWEVAYDLGFVKAYLIVWADVLIQWAPVHYELEAGVRIGVQVNIKLGLLRIRFKIEIGATLRIWGPPFAGQVRVHLWIFSFTIPFGDHSKPVPEPLSWGEFSKSFLPPAKDKKSGESQKESAQEGVIGTAPMATIISDGIIEEHKNEAGEVSYTLVNPHKLLIAVDSAIPVTAMNVNGEKDFKNTKIKLANNSEGNTVISYSKREKKLGIRPMRKPLSSALMLEVKYNGKPVEEMKMDILGIGKSVPKALWSPEFPEKRTSIDDLNEEENAVIRNVLSGIELAPKRQEIPKGTPQFDLDGTYNEVDKTLIWTNEKILLGPSNESYRESLKEIMEDSISQKGVLDKRDQLLQEVISNSGLNEIAPEDDLRETGLIHQWIDSLAEEPVIVPTGGMPQYPREKGVKIDKSE